MPKEVIRRADPNEVLEIEVGWSQDARTVQLGVAGCSGTSLNWILHASAQDSESEKKRIEDLAQAFFQCLDQESDGRFKRDEIRTDDETVGRAMLNAFDVHGPYRYIYAHMDRDGCNELVRVTRRARDSAFGRDE